MKKILVSLIALMFAVTAYSQTNVVVIDETNKALRISNDLSTDRAIEVIPGLQISRVYVIDAATAKIGIRTDDGRETTITLTRLSNSTYSAGDNAAISAFLTDLQNIMAPPTTSYGAVVAVNAISTSTTLDETYSFIKADATSGAVVLTLPPAANATRHRYVVTKIDATANDVTFDGSGSETIDGLTTAVLRGQWSTMVIVCDGTSWFSESKDQHKFVATTTTATLTASSSDGFVTADGTAAAYTITLPAAAIYEGRMYTFLKIDATVNDVTIDGNASETINGLTTAVLKGQWASLKIVSDGTNWIIVDENLNKLVATTTTVTLATSSEDGLVSADATGGAYTITLPAAALYEGRSFSFLKIDATASDVTIDGNASETINGVTTYLMKGFGSYVSITSDGSNWFVVGQPTGNKITTVTTTYTATYADETIIADGTGGAFTITLPTAVGCEGRKYTIKSIHGNDVTVEGDGAEEVDAGTNYLLDTIMDHVTLQSNGAKWWVLEGN